METISKECNQDISSLAFQPEISAPLKWLHDPNAGGILGRTEQRHGQYGHVGLGRTGRVSESACSEIVNLDLLEPHVAIVVGARGSGKSMTEGVCVEELATSGLSIGTVVIDRCGVYARLKEANSDPVECEELNELNISAGGLEHVRVFATGHLKSGMELFRLTVSDMTADDWLQFWALPVEGPQANLIRELVNYVIRGYELDHGKTVAPNAKYCLMDMVECLADCSKLQDRYPLQTIRSVLQRIEAAESLELFAAEGTGIEELSVAGQVSVLDLSHSLMDAFCASKIVGIVARKILQSRQDSVRDGINYIPVTWLVVDEAHLYVGDDAPKGSDADLVSYCKLGRRPGCGLILGTQQPSAVNAGVLSQADIVIAHQLVLEADIAALKRIIPASRPDEIFGSANILRKLPPGYAVVADKLTQERPVVVKIRPRKTCHDGASALPGKLEAVPTAPIRKRKAFAAQEKRPMPNKECSEIREKGGAPPESKTRLHQLDTGVIEGSEESNRAGFNPVKGLAQWAWNKLDV